ncbi:hypothetical protein GLOIN_2v1787998 [Rhizophagus irregularis DAOM 181602=DAOM 197198]|nr:hypothetical protein GLOIN_2v1787998 [Rhizophagus irregularis DAOM 181602=DAOM 197198]
MMIDLLRRCNYNKTPLVFSSNVFYWELNNYPISDTLKNNLPIFNDYFVENFYSSIRSQTYCFNFLSFGIQKNINTLTARLTTTLKDNEIPLVEEEINNSLNENNDENMQNILERLKQNIDNQFKILYQKWSDYDSL